MGECTGVSWDGVVDNRSNEHGLEGAASGVDVVSWDGIGKIGRLASEALLLPTQISEKSKSLSEKWSTEFSSCDNGSVRKLLDLGCNGFDLSGLDLVFDVDLALRFLVTRFSSSELVVIP